MISFEEKDAIAASFPELTRKEVSMGRVNYHFEGSIQEKKIVVYHLHPNGNGFVYAGLLGGVPTDEKGFANIRELTADELKTLIRRSIRSLGPEDAQEEEKLDEVEGASSAEDEEVFTELREEWRNADGHRLDLHFEPEDEMWMTFAGDMIDSAFETYEEAVEYLQEEGFVRS
ncbi:hypothetical protein [Gorillibacterium sp. CAU 1737]|uniref:hypothetical protein n=1 Tax=Gorillibacterium sp. CAU 1737 TaxID=3140362 RepID=UPI00326038B6